MLPHNTDYASVFRQSVPLLDVRAPVEYAQGAFPLATNYPLLNDQERHAVGLCYKEQGQDAAITLGHTLVSGTLRQQRLEQWIRWCTTHPTGMIYCFRGGLRSRTVQQWLAEAGHIRPIIRGGYKAMRRYLTHCLETLPTQTAWILLSGRTGTGKTRVIEALEHSLDLEGYAQHRGSAFGRRPEGQPSQIDFEHRIAIRLLQLQTQEPGALVPDLRPIVVEDESKLIGQRLVPPVLLQAIKQAPRVVIEEPLDQRVEVILEDYILNPLLFWQRQEQATERAFDELAAHLLGALDRIRNRLGGARHVALREQLQHAIMLHQQQGDAQAHRAWIEALLVHYYDPQYDYARSRQTDTTPTLFRGPRDAVLEFLQSSPGGSS